MAIRTLLCNEGFPARWESDHDYTDLCVFHLDTHTVSLSGSRHLHVGLFLRTSRTQITKEEEMPSKREV